MTDLELVKRCAEKMGLAYKTDSMGRVFLSGAFDEFSPHHDLLESYDPLHDRAQAMELVERFRLNIWQSKSGIRVMYEDGPSAWADDLSRAICECVAKMP